jgi:eukaryotic-like serine/threonine-protein kinase
VQPSAANQPPAHTPAEAAPQAASPAPAVSGRAPDDGTSEGKVIGGRYELLRLIGRGGMGEVHAARNLLTGREVALKLIRGSETTPEQNRRFMREAKAATAIRHPNVIDVLDVFQEEDGTPVMVMELLRGESLSSLRKRVGKLELGQAATIMAPVLCAVQAAHAKRIVHRDLKPENIFLAELGEGIVRPKVLDFGIAKVLDGSTLGGETHGAATSTGTLLGTPQYMSYEQAMSEKDIDHRADIWSLGVILFELLCGRRPLEFQNLGGMFAAFLQGTVPSIRELAPELPDELATLIDRALGKTREGRLDDLSPLIDALAPYVDPTVVPQLVKSLPPAAGAATAGAKTASEAGAHATEHSFAAATPAPTPAATPPSARPAQRSRALLFGLAAIALAAGGAVLALRGAGGSIPAPVAPGTGSVGLAVPGAATPGGSAAPDAGALSPNRDSTTSPDLPVEPSASLAPLAPTNAPASTVTSGSGAGPSRSGASSGAPAATSSPSAAPSAAPQASGRKPKGLVEELPY